MIKDVVVVERAELERLRRRCAAWKRSAKEWRRSSQLQCEFKEQWYQGYRRAWKLDEPDRVGQSVGAIGWGIVAVAVLVGLTKLVMWIHG